MYEFSLAPPSGFTFSTVSIEAQSAGSLIGNYHPDQNPTGTRTKPGLFGSFGATENVSVPTSARLEAAGAPSVHTGGGFRLAIDIAAGSAMLSSYVSTTAGTPTGRLNLTAHVQTDTFRTRFPDSIFPGIPVSLPMGEATLDSLSVQQVGDSVGGTLTPAGPDAFDLALLVPVEFTAQVQVLGSPLAVGPLAGALPFTGRLTLVGDSALLEATSPLDQSQVVPVDIQVPTIPFSLPTVLPPGATAEVLLDLRVSELAATLQGSATLRATGVLIPEPATVLLIAAWQVLASRRPERALKRVLKHAARTRAFVAAGPSAGRG